MFNKLFAVCLLVEDFDKALAFYKETLGLEVNSHEGQFADFKLEGISLAIFQRDAATSMFPRKHMGQTGGSVLAFQVDDVKKTTAELKAKGVEVFEGPKTTDWGQTVAYFKDPDGNIWEVSQK